MLHALPQLEPDIFGPVEQAIVVLPIVPMFHANAWGVPWAAPLTGCKLVLSADYRPERMCELFRDEKVTHSAGVPTVWLAMIEHIERTGEDLGRLKQVTIGGSAAPRAMIRWFARRGVEVGHAWGMTETSPIGTLWCAAGGLGRDVATTSRSNISLGRAGSPFGVELRIVDDEGNVLAARRRRHPAACSAAGRG